MASCIEALETQLSALEAEAEERFRVLSDLAWALCDTDLHRAQSHNQTAI